MEYSYNVLNEVYEWMKTKRKTVEVRILKEKSALIQEGDYIIFHHIDDSSKTIKVKVIKKHVVDNVGNLFGLYSVDQMMPGHTEDDLRNLLHHIYGDLLITGKLVTFEFEYEK